MQLWICENYVVTDSAYQVHQQYNATCQAACTDSSTSLSLPTQVPFLSTSTFALPNTSCD